MADMESGSKRSSQLKDVSPLEGRTVLVAGQPQLVKVEPSYWEALDDICQREELSLDDLCTDLANRIEVSSRRSGPSGSLANAVRVFIVGYYRQAATESGHRNAGHGLGDPFVGMPANEGLTALRH